MRTKEARRMRNKGLKRAKRKGHVVATICETEAFSAYGCMNCNATMDFTDDAGQPSSRALLKIYFLG